MSIRSLFIAGLIAGAASAPAFATTGFTFFDDAAGIGYHPPATTLSRAQVLAALKSDAHAADAQTMANGYPVSTLAAPPSGKAQAAPAHHALSRGGLGVPAFDGQRSAY